MASVPNYLSVMPGIRNGALIGVLFHTCIVHVEFELYMYHFIASYAAAFFIFLFAAVQIGDHALIAALVQTIAIFSSFNAGILTSMAIYRLFLHRCRAYPGPFLAKLTRFYTSYVNAKTFQYTKELRKMHSKYGGIVRTGPRELSILDKAAIPAIYGPGSECRKASWYGQAGNNPDKVSINMMRDPKKYRLRRRAWDRGFSMKALSSYEPRIQSKVTALISQIRSHNRKPLNITDWAMFFSFDVMGEVAFSKDFNNLTHGVEHPAIKCIHEHMAMLAVLQAVPWFLNLLGSIPGAARGFSEFFGVCERETREKEKVLDVEEEPRDIVSWLLKAIKERDVSASPTRESLADDTRVVVIAGSDTTANTLANALFYLAKYPATQKKLQTLLDAAIPDTANPQNHYEKVKTITYIDDIIHETLRLKPPVVQGGPRETPAQGIRFGDTQIPGNVTVSVPYTLIHRDARWWNSPETFIPERFGEKREEMGTDEAPYFPFQLGLHSCIGKNLAMLSLRMALASIIQSFDVCFAEGETGEEFDERFWDTFLMTLPPLKLVFTPRLRA